MSEAIQGPTPTEYAWGPQLGPQLAAIDTACWVDELFFGGAVFGGKSDFLIGDFAQDLEQGPLWQGILFRRHGPELHELIRRSQEIYPYLGGQWKEAKKEWHWEDGPFAGASLLMRHLENEKDVMLYMGHSYSWIAWDELPNMATMEPYRMMISRLRGPAKNKRIRSTGNPGGLCHNEIKAHFGIAEHPKGNVPLRHSKSKMTRMFLPSFLHDNKIGIEADPDYENRLEGLQDPELIRAWKFGDWNAIRGNYFSKFNQSGCMVDPFEIPKHWPLIGCMDYGESNPTWFGILTRDYDGRVFVVDEYCRRDTGGAEHCRGILSLLETSPYLKQREPEPEKKLDMIMAPSDMKIKRKPGEAKLETSAWETFADHNLHLTPANMHRVQGARNMKDLLYNGRLFFFEGTTERVLSSIGTVQRSTTDPEDVAKVGDDHPYDGLRYGINHLWTPQVVKVPDPNSAQNLIDRLNEVGEFQRGKYG